MADMDIQNSTVPSLASSETADVLALRSVVNQSVDSDADIMENRSHNPATNADMSDAVLENNAVEEDELQLAIENSLASACSR